MPGKRTRDEVEVDKRKSKKYIDKGAKALGRAENLDIIIELLLDIRDTLIEVNSKL